MKLGLDLILAEVIQQCWKLDDFSFPILNGISTCCFEIKDEEVLEVLSYGFGRHFESLWR